MRRCCHSGPIYRYSSAAESYRLVFGIHGLLDSNVHSWTPTFRPYGHDSFDHCWLVGSHLSVSILNTSSHSFPVEHWSIPDCVVLDCKPTDHGIVVSHHLCWSLIKEVPTELTVDLAFLMGVVINILSFSHYYVAWVDIPACSLLSRVFADVIHYEADHVLIPL